MLKTGDRDELPLEGDARGADDERHHGSDQQADARQVERDGFGAESEPRVQRRRPLPPQSHPHLLPEGAGWPETTVAEDLDAALEQADAVMALRIQRERQGANYFPSLDEYSRYFGLDRRAAVGAQWVSAASQRSRRRAPAEVAARLIANTQTEWGASLSWVAHRKPWREFDFCASMR